MAKHTPSDTHIVVLDGLDILSGAEAWAPLAALGQVRLEGLLPPAEAQAAAQAAELLLVTNRAGASARLIEHCPRLRYIGVLSTGYNTVDVAAAVQRGITVTNIPGYSTASVAQLAFALLLELCCHTGQHSRDVKSGLWRRGQQSAFHRYPLTELASKTLGLVGYGDIGRAVGHIAAAFGMRVVAHTRTPRPETPGVTFCTLDTLLSTADVVSLHCPLTGATRGIIGVDALAHMKPGALLLNTARGPLLDEAAVAAALHTGRLGGLGADVAAQEPISPESPLLTAPNCVLTPHIGWATHEARSRLVAIAIENVRAFLAGAPVNTVAP
ncbi:MAG: D-2-hydroxyacid dehydrogenase [Oscillospiraceae bacterium]